MKENTNTLESKVETVDIDIDEMFNPGVGANSVTLPDENAKPSIFSKQRKEADFSFTEEDDADDSADKDDKEAADGDDTIKKPEASKEDNKATGKELLDGLLEEEDGEEDDEGEGKKETRGRKSISGISDVFSKLIKEDKIVAFDDDKDLADYSAKDWEELIDANLEERANQVRRETPKQFFDSLPEELQVAARYVADGGQDLKGLFSTLAASEERKSLDVTNESHQKMIISDYLQATGYGNLNLSWTRCKKKLLLKS